MWWLSNLRRVLTPWNPYYQERRRANPNRVKLPDILAHVRPSASDASLELRVNSRCKVAMDLSKISSRGAGPNMKAGLLAAMCLPTVDLGQLCVCADFLNWVVGFEYAISRAGDVEAMVIIEDASRVFTSQDSSGLSNVLHGVWTRVQASAKGPIQDRFVQAVCSFLEMTYQFCEDRRAGAIPDVESYIDMQRAGAWCNALFVLIEFTQGLYLPDSVRDHHTVASMQESARDAIVWSMEIMARVSSITPIPSNNLVSLITSEHDVPVQSALDFVGDLVSSRIKHFVSARSSLPSWNAVIDANLETYSRGLEDCIAGVIQWCFESERYFGKDGSRVLLHRLVDLGSLY